MSDHQHRHTLFAQPDQQIENLLLNGYIQCGRGFIGDYQIWTRDSCHCYHRSLTHPSRKLERVHSYAALRLRYSHICQRLYRASVCALSVSKSMPEQSLHKLATDGYRRIERLHRILKHHSDSSPPLLAKTSLTHRQEIHRFAIGSQSGRTTCPRIPGKQTEQ